MNLIVLTAIAFAGIAANNVLKVSSPAFKDGGTIPTKYTCEGANMSPPLDISGVPSNAKSLVLIMTDPDAPKGVFDHWVLWNIPPTTTKIAENGTVGVVGKNGMKKNAYGGPCPPSGKHHYHFDVYAVDVMLELKNDAGKEEVLKAIDGHILATGELVGVFEKSEAPVTTK